MDYNFAKITTNVLVNYLFPHLNSSSVQNMFLLEKRVNEAMKEKEHSKFIWHLFWTKEERRYENGQLAYQRVCKDGKLEGVCTWHGNGKRYHQQIYGIEVQLCTTIIFLVV